MKMQHSNKPRQGAALLPLAHRLAANLSPEQAMEQGPASHSASCGCAAEWQLHPFSVRRMCTNRSQGLGYSYFVHEFAQFLHTSGACPGSQNSCM